MAGLQICRLHAPPALPAHLLERTVWGDTGGGRASSALSILPRMWPRGLSVSMSIVSPPSQPLSSLGPCSVQSTRRAVPRRGLTWGSGETVWLRPRQRAKLRARALRQPAAARSSSRPRKVPRRARLGEHALRPQMEPDREAGHRGPWSECQKRAVTQ